MGVDTHVLLDGHVPIEEIVEWVAVTTLSPITHIDLGQLNGAYLRDMPCLKDMHQISFEFRGEQRMLTVFTNGNCGNDYADTTTEPMTLVTFGCWGSNEALANSLLDRFGGYYDYNDCDEIDYQRREKVVDYLA